MRSFEQFNTEDTEKNNGWTGRSVFSVSSSLRSLC
jgi:hypothetical protein